MREKGVAMPLYITLSRGPRADQAKPVLVLSDKRAIAALLREMGKLEEEGGERDASTAGVRPTRRAPRVRHKE